MTHQYDWTTLYEAYESCGKKCRDFCEEQGVPFFLFRGYLISRSAATRKAEKEQELSGASSPLFVEVSRSISTAVVATPTYEVTFPNGRSLTIKDSHLDLGVLVSAVAC